MSIIKTIFSIEKKETYKSITILGIKIKIICIKALNEKMNQLSGIFKYINYAKFQVNKDIVDVRIEKFKRKGISGINTSEKRDKKIIVSLTSFPERIGDVYYAIFSLLNQTLKPDKVILWLAKSQFPDEEEDVSEKLLELKKYGLSIKFTKDIRSYKKFIPTAKLYPNDIIVTADDDIYYPEHWLEQLYGEYSQDTSRIYAHRCHKVLLNSEGVPVAFKKFKQLIDDESSSYLNFLTTGGGVLFPPNSLHVDAYKEEIFSELSPNCDESWLWAMAVLNKTKIKVVKNPVNHITLINALRAATIGNEITLTNINVHENKKDKQIHNILTRYPEIISILKSQK